MLEFYQIAKLRLLAFLVLMSGCQTNQVNYMEKNEFCWCNQMKTDLTKLRDITVFFHQKSINLIFFSFIFSLEQVNVQKCLKSWKCFQSFAALFNEAVFNVKMFSTLESYLPSCINRPDFYFSINSRFIFMLFRFIGSKQEKMAALYKYHTISYLFQTMLLLEDLICTQKRS